MKNLHLALQSFWEQLDIPVYLQGCVPCNKGGQICAAYPYITYTPTEPAPNSTTVLTAQLWIRDTESGNSERAQKIDGIGQMIPPGGTLIDCGTAGKLHISRNDPFAVYINDPDDSEVIGARISYIVRYLSL